MITQSVFRRNYFVFASIVVVFILIGVATSWIILTAQRGQMEAGPAQYISRFFVSMDSDPYRALEKIKKSWPDGASAFDLIDSTGTSTVSHKKIVEKDWLENKVQNLESQGYASLSGGFFGGPPTLILKTQTPGLYLVHKVNFTGRPQGPPFPPGGPPPSPRRPPTFRGPPHGGGPDFLLITLGSITACVLISLGIALFYQFSKYKHQANEAFAVLNQLRAGNLGARMSTLKRNELSALTDAFNLMADDVEHLVDNLRKADVARRSLLQDLAHDLRTPLTSLKTFLETLKTADHKLTDEKRQEVLSLCVSETEYFANLVEDLLFMAQITEPKYSKGTEQVYLDLEIQDQLRIFKERNPQLSFEYSADSAAKSAVVIGSSKLLNRALRNAFDNSSSFAKSKVGIEMHLKDNILHVTFTDDGPGFSPKSLNEFGHKKASRMLTGTLETQRISVGIGSVIMREILLLHSGELKAENIFDGERVLGGRVSFSLSLI